MPKAPTIKHNTAATNANAKKPSANPPIHWHELHCDPILDVAIISKDGVYFRASSHALKRETSLFEGMFEVSPPPYMTATDAIGLDYSADSIEIFLDCYATPNLPDYSEVAFSLLYELRKLLDYISCDRLLPLAVQAFRKRSSKHPMEWLLLANDDNDLEGASQALVVCGRKRVPLTNKNVFSTISQLRSEWRYPLLQCMLRYQPSDPDTQFEVVWPDTERVKQFKEDVRATPS